MRLIELQPGFLRHEVRVCAGYGVDPECITVSPHTEHEYHVRVDTVTEADGIAFLCPKCFAANSNSDVGTHWVICWRPRVAPEITPKPGRWELVGTNFDDLNLIAGSSSVALQGGCGAHFLVVRGEIQMCP